MSDRKRVVITVHGIRTFGQWQDRLQKLLAGANSSTTVAAYKYGYFSVVAFILPMLRWFAVRTFRKQLETRIKDNPGALFCFVGHSFGTHLLVYGLRGIDTELIKTIEIDTIILSGSVLRSRFDWDHFLERVPARRVVNDCGLNDVVLILSQFCVLFTGMAGRSGFYGFTGIEVVNRYFPGGHSHYFQPGGPDLDSFMRQYWLGIIARGEDPESVDQRVPPTPLAGVVATLLPFMDVAKLAIYGLIAWLALDALYLRPRAEAQTEHATREIASAASLFEADSLVPSAYSSLARLISTNSIPDDTQRQQALKIAGYALQRLLPFDQAYAQVADGSLFRWEGTIYLKAESPVRLDTPKALSYAPVPALKRVVVVESDTTVSILDALSGAVIARKTFGRIGEPIDALDYYLLPKSPTKIAVSFHEPYNDKSGGSSYSVVIDVAEATFNELAHGFTTTTDCNEFVLRAVDDSFPDDLEEAEQSKLNEETKQLAACTISPELQIKAFELPATRAEANAWIRSGNSYHLKPDKPVDDPQGCDRLVRTTHFPLRTRHDGQSLDFSQLDQTDLSPTRESAEGFFVNRLAGGSYCFAEFSGPLERRFIAAEPDIDQYGYNGMLCEVVGNVRVRRCRYLSSSLDSSSGGLWLSPDRTHLVFATDLDGGWEWIGLDKLEAPPIDGEMVRGIASIAINQQVDQVMVASPVDGQPGAIEVWAYRVGDGAKLAARRIFDMPHGFAAPTRPDPAAAVAAMLFTADNQFYLATSFEQVFALSLSDDGAVPRWIRDLWRGWTNGERTSETVGLAWATPSAGFGTRVRYTPSAETGVLAMYSSDSLRLLNLADGRFLTPVIHLNDLARCHGTVEKIELPTNGAVIAQLATAPDKPEPDRCAIWRPAPLPQALLLDLINNDNDSVYFGEGPPWARKLPGEIAAPH
jgi:hypothetical protein